MNLNMMVNGLGIYLVIIENMKKIALIITALFIGFMAFAQAGLDGTWYFEEKQNDAGGGNEDISMVMSVTYTFSGNTYKLGMQAQADMDLSGTDKNGKAYIANVGDSRCYLLSRFTKRIRQITVDHSLVEEYVRAGIITPEEARNHPKKNIITRAIGTGDPEPEADIFKLHIQRGQALLLCSDGLSNSVPDKEILNSYLQIPNDPETLCRRLLDFAFQGGARDNVTMLVVVRV